MSQPDLIIHDEKDNVGVVVIETTKKGQDCSAWIMENDKTVKVSSMNEVPLGHKIALQDLKEGDTILKYCLLYTSPSPRDRVLSRMPSSA